MRLLRAGASLGALVVVALAGCTTLDVQPMNPSAPDPERVFYVLPYTQFDVAITRRVTACGQSMTVEVSAEATPRTEDDWRAAYEIDQRSLSHLFNTAKLTVEFHEDENKQRTNRIRTINASVDDQTLPAIGHIVTGLGRLANVAATGGGAGSQNACSPATIAALARVATLTDDVRRITREVEADNTAIAEMRRIRTALGVTAGDADGPQLRNRMRQRAARIELLTAKQAELQRDLRTISYVQEVRWPESSGVFQTTTPLAPDPAKIGAWMRPGGGDVTASELRELEVHMRLERSTPAGRNIHGDTLFQNLEARAPGAATPSDATAEAARVRQRVLAEVAAANAPAPDRGLRYRVPMPGRLVICQRTSCDGEDTKVVNRVETSVAQLGFIQTIPIRARFLENVSFQATFTTSGAPSSIGYTSTGGGAAASQQLAAIMGQVATIREAERTYEAGAAQRELQQQQLALQTLQAEAALAAARNETVQETSALALQTALVRARIAQLEAERQWTTLNAAGQ